MSLTYRLKFSILYPDSVSTERSSTQSPPSALVPSQRHSPIGAEGSDDEDDVEVHDEEGDNSIEKVLA